MRIPRSTLVMAVLTCVPFGLAVRDYVQGSDNVERDSDDDSDSDYDGEDLARYQREMEAERAEEAREEARQAERTKKLKLGLESLIGKAPGTLGTAFGKISPGMTDSELAKHDDAIASLRSLTRGIDLYVAYDDAEGLLQYVEVTPRDGASGTDEICNAISEQLEATWSAAESSGETSVWRDAATGVRAELSHNYSCSLTFRRYVEPEQWIAKQGGVIPTAAVGQPHAKLVKSLEPQRVDLGDAEYYISWIAPGLGSGTSPTSMTAYITNGKVTAVVAKADTTFATYEKLQAHMEALYGAGKEDDEGALVWMKKPRVALSYIDGSTVVSIGTLQE
jgi:hypothetical protein